MAEQDGAVSSGTPAEASKKKSNPLVRVGLIAFIVVVAVGAGVHWFLTRNDIETDDAFTAGRAVTIAPHVRGYVTALLVNDNQFVHAGDLLAKIDDRDYRAARDNAAATLDIAQAQAAGAQFGLLVAQKDFPGRLMVAQGQLLAAQAQQFKAETDDRRQHAVARAATTQQDIDYATAAVQAAKAQLLQAQGNLQVALPVQANISTTQTRVGQFDAQMAQAKAQLAQADLNLGWTEIRAPHDGWISQRNIERGSFVSEGQSIFSIVEPEVWVIANYKETQLTHMRAGQKVDIAVDAYPFLTLRGHVDSLQLGTGATFSAFPPENATGNYVKIVQRVPVKILIDEGLRADLPLSLGLSVEPTVYTK
jgi:membrane fusion protein, multidrug efflux system